MGKGASRSLFMKLLVVGIIVIFLSTYANAIQNPWHNLLQLSSVGYPSAFQGPTITFYAEEWNGKQYVQAADTLLTFNPNVQNQELGTYVRLVPPGVFTCNYPQINGQMTTCFLPESSSSVSNFGWLNQKQTSEWTNNLGLVSNGWNQQSPEATYNWTSPNGNDTYCMARYEMKFYAAFVATWLAGSGSGGDPCNFVDALSRPSVENVYHNLNIWFEIDTTPTWYIAGGGTAYFAIAKIQLGEDAAYGGVDTRGNKIDKRTDIKVNPESQPSVDMLYYAPFKATPTSVPVEQYKNKDLNPSYFRNTTYTYVDLTNFGDYSNTQNLFGSTTKGDTVTFCFDVTVFVIGEYTVQDIQADPSHYGYFVPASSQSQFFSDFWGWLFSAQTLSWLIPVVIFVALLIFAPWVIIALIGAFRGGKH